MSLDELNFSRRPRLPLIMSAEGGECSLACLAMVARYYGHDIDLNGLRQRFSVSLNGASLRTIVRVSETLGLRARALRIELEMIGRLQTPAILHWDLNHFVVLKRATKSRVEIHDPSRGAKSLSFDEASRHFTGVALELSPEADFTPISARAPVRLSGLWSNVVGAKAAILQVLAYSFALQLVTFALPFQLQLVVDEGIAKGDAAFLSTIAVGFGLLILIQAATGVIRDWSVNIFGNLFSYQVLGNIGSHLFRLPSAYFESRHVGDIVSRVQSSAIIQQIIARGFVAAVIDGVMAAVALSLLVLYAPLLVLISVGTFALNALVAAVSYSPMRRRLEEQMTASAREQSHFMESIRAASIVKVMGREAQREGAWRALLAAQTNAAVSVSKYKIATDHARTLISGIGFVAIVYVGATQIVAGDAFTVGMLYAYLAFNLTFTDRANSLITQLVELATIGLHLERIGDITSATAEDISTKSVLSKITGSIRLADVSFRYSDADPLIIRNVNLEICAGEFVAITGRSGGGKTTLLRVMLGLRAPTSGAIELDGIAADPGLFRSWRESVGVVSQDDRLLSGTIADNIAFFDPDLNMDAVMRASVQACIHDDIMKMPMGYLSLVGDMGSALSGGQKQRVLLARALYRDPKVLILDEGTANLDEATERKIADVLCGLAITRVVVAHRPALIARADRVVEVAPDGRLVEWEERASSPEHP